MAIILPFKKPVSGSATRRKATPKGLCQHGHHKWKIWQDKQFDVRVGKLVTVYRCQRCGKQKVKSH